MYDECYFYETDKVMRLFQKKLNITAHDVGLHLFPRLTVFQI